MTYLIFDLAILALLAFFVWRGASKGFVLTLCGLVAVLVALVGASFLADALSPRVGAALEPKFAAMIEEQLSESLSSVAPEDASLPAVLEVLEDMGLYQDLIDTVENAVNDGLLDVAANAAAAVAAAIAQAVAYAILFLLFFVLILIAWTILSHALDLVTKLPGLNALNKTCGALMGFVKGVIILFVAAWLLRLSGTVLPQETVEQTYLLRFFITTNPVSLLTGF